MLPLYADVPDLRLASGPNGQHNRMVSMETPCIEWPGAKRSGYGIKRVKIN